MGVLPAPPFKGVILSSIAYADIDNDNDLDILLTGRIGSGVRTATLYVNDGSGIFTEVPDTPFEGVASKHGAAAFADIDGDNDPDILITGDNDLLIPTAKLYVNDGTGTFTEVLGTPFEGVSLGSVSFSDVDGDNDLDVLITGGIEAGGLIAKLYSNDGTGTFTEVMGTPFEGVEDSSVAFADVDGDNDEDLLITGQGTIYSGIAKLYRNDGTGNFTLVTGTPFVGLELGGIAFADVDGDNDQDVLFTGYVFGAPTFQSAILYRNDGMGNFTEVAGTNFQEVVISSVAFADIDGDNDQDVLITGQDNTLTSNTKIYSNDGNGNFTVIAGDPFVDVDDGGIAFLDVDGDNDQDALITGRLADGITRVAELYSNDGNGNFTELEGTPFEGVQASSMAISDINADNFQDVFLTGANGSGTPISKLYSNDGLGNFIQIAGTPFEGVSFSSVAISDINGDDYPDVLLTGANSSGTPISKLYTNDGLGDFTLMPGTPFEGVESSSVFISDINGDDFRDVLLTGANSSGTPISKLYTNDGLGNFTLMPGTPFEGVESSSVVISDINGDDFPDVILTGANSSGTPISKLYTNDGLGNFTLISGTPFAGVASSSVVISDVNGDDFRDVLLAGRNSSGVPITKLYTNDGLGNFTEMAGTPFDNVEYASVAFSDVDGDNFLDVLLTGANSSGEGISKLYLNDGLGAFTEYLFTPFDGVQSGSIAFSDLNGDNDPDVLITGRNNSSFPIARLFFSVSPFTDADNDGFPISEDCDDGNPNVNPDQDEIPYNGLDDDCDPMTLDDDLDQDGFVLAEDCDDENPDINPDAMEIPNNNIDEDCNGEDLITATYELANGLVTIFPNPARDFIKISKPENMEVDVKLFDSTGRLLYSGFNSHLIDLTSYSSGIYLLELTERITNQKMVERIVIIN